MSKNSNMARRPTNLTEKRENRAAQMRDEAGSLAGQSAARTRTLREREPTNQPDI